MSKTLQPKAGKTLTPKTVSAKKDAPFMFDMSTGRPTTNALAFMMDNADEQNKKVMEANRAAYNQMSAGEKAKSFANDMLHSGSRQPSSIDLMIALSQGKGLQYDDKSGSFKIAKGDSYHGRVTTSQWKASVMEFAGEKGLNILTPENKAAFEKSIDDMVKEHTGEYGDYMEYTGTEMMTALLPKEKAERQAMGMPEGKTDPFSYYGSFLGGMRKDAREFAGDKRGLHDFNTKFGGPEAGSDFTKTFAADEDQLDTDTEFQMD